MVEVLNRAAIKEPPMLDRVISLKPTPRVKRLREAFLNVKPTATITRARIETRVMKETASEPIILRRAKIFTATVREMPVEIYPH